LYDTITPGGQQDDSQHGDGDKAQGPAGALLLVVLQVFFIFPVRVGVGNFLPLLAIGLREIVLLSVRKSSTSSSR
jgi:hypothetical protein